VVRLEPLEADRVDDAEPLYDHWGYDRGSFERLVEASRGTSVLACVDGDAVGMTLGFPWGEVGWIGGVLTLEDHRGKGLGQATVEASLERLHEAGCETVKLYATPKAVSLYERVGFTGEAEYAVATGSQRRGRDPDVVPLEGRVDEVARLDREAFPGDRRRLLAAYAREHPDLAVGVEADGGELAGFGFARAGSEVTEIGPVVVEEGDANLAQDLVDALLTRIPDQPVELVYPADAWAASSAWSCRGFVTVDSPLEMRHGPPVEEHRDAIVACAGQEVG
jgi:GNAT superfamily N-acetyltransferase